MPKLKIRWLRWWIIGLLMLGSIVNYLTRSSLAVAAPTLMQNLGINEREYSWIVGTFQGAIMFQPICGYVLDVVGLKIGFAIFAIAWSLISMAHGLAHNWQSFAGLRGMLGFAEGCANPAGMKATAEWFPARERGLAGGIFNIGASVGSMLAPPLVAWAILATTGRPRSSSRESSASRGRQCGWRFTTRPRNIPPWPIASAITSPPARKSIWTATARLPPC
jgi:ACS family hexuronate transporter-like MFS transporter